ncbi:MAG TPA: hypothetical protein VF507_05510 [Pyrinomonadaceae bacterium]
MTARTEDDRAFEDAIDPDNWTETKGYGFTCLNDHAGRGFVIFSANAPTLEEAQVLAETAGWRKEGKVWSCPTCAYESDLDDQAEAQYLQ